MNVNMGNAYVSVKDFKKLERKVNSIIDIHTADSKLTKEEKKLAREAKRDLRLRKNIIPIEEL